MIKAGIIGGAGYTAGELLRILMEHPGAEAGFIHSSSHNEMPVTTVHRDLVGETDLHFTEIDFNKADVLFLCMGHGKSADFLSEHTIPGHLKIVDLSRDFRLPAPGNEFIYGLPELNRDKIKHAEKIANPGCFATAINLALLPLIASKQLKTDIHVSAITGSTGAGQALTPAASFNWRSSNMGVYKIFEHQHLDEIHQIIRQMNVSCPGEVLFMPMRGSFTRGILASVYTRTDLNENALNSLYCQYFQKHPFVTVSKEDIDIKQVVNTNKCLLHVIRKKDYAVIISVIDNLIKGASGQAVQNMNLMFDLDEKAGLKLKPVVF